MIMKSSLAIVFATLTTASVFAGQAFTWNGGASGRWDVPANWTPNGTPGADDDVVISSTATIDLGNATCDAKTIKPVGTATTPIAVTLSNGTIRIYASACDGSSWCTFTLDGVTLAMQNSSWAYAISNGKVVLANDSKMTFGNAGRYWYNINRENYGLTVRDGTSEPGKLELSWKSKGTKTIEVDNGVLKTASVNLAMPYGSTGDGFVVTLTDGGRIESTGAFTATALKGLVVTLPAQPSAAAAIVAGGAFSLSDANATVTIDATPCAEGTYKVVSAKTLTLPDGKGIDTWSVTTAEGYKGTLAQVGTEITLTVASAEVEDNEWVTEPSISKTYWNAGESAGTISLGEAKYGQTVCNYTQDQINALSVGRYTLTFTVEKTASYTGLSKSIDILVMGPDTQAATYTWKSAVLTGNWCDPQNWTTDVGTQGFPSNALASAVLPSGGPYEIDLQGCTVPLKNAKGSLSLSCPLTLRNGIVKTGTVTPPGNARVTLDAASIEFYSWSYSYTMMKGSSLEMKNGSSFLTGGLLANGQGNVCVIRDGTTTIGQGVTFGPTAVVTTETGLTVTNATLRLVTDFTVQNSSGSVLPCIKLQEGRIVSSNSGKPSAARFMMNAAAKTELMLKAGDKAAPRISAYTVQLQNMTFAVTSVEATGRYPLAYAQNGITFVGEEYLGGCTLDLSALGKGYSGRLELSEDGKTLSAKISRGGTVILIQ